MNPIFEKIAEVLPGKGGQIKLAYALLRGSPFIDEVDAEIDKLVKEAGWKDVGQGIAATIGAGIAYNLAGEIYNKVRYGVTKSKNFKTMLKENPDIDPKNRRVKMVFDTLHRMNPEYASDPLVAGDFVKTRIEGVAPMGDLQALDKLVGARSALSSSKRLPIHSLPTYDFSGTDATHRKAQTALFEAQTAAAKNEAASHPLKERQIQTNIDKNLADIAGSSLSAARDLTEAGRHFGGDYSTPARAAYRRAASYYNRKKTAEGRGHFVANSTGLRFVARG